MNVDDLGDAFSQSDALGTIAFAYDANGNVLSVTEGTSVLSRSVDAFDSEDTGVTS